MEQLQPGQARFRIHGSDSERDELISGTLFANKLSSLLRALKAADKIANGCLFHEYRILKLESSSPTVTLVEVPGPKVENHFPGHSGVASFERCANAVLEGDTQTALTYGNCAKHISKLASGAHNTYGYAEIWTRENNIVRVDDFLAEQSAEVIHPDKRQPVNDDQNWYKGHVEATFDGAIKAVDLRGELPEIKLILTAGRKELDCVCDEDSKKAIADNLDSRVRLHGRAYYDGKSGLPRRIEVREIEAMAGDVDFEIWRGKFAPFEPPDWSLTDS